MSLPSPFVYAAAVALFGLAIPSATAQGVGSNGPSTTGPNQRSYNSTMPNRDRPAGYGQYLSTDSSTAPETLAAAQSIGSHYANPYQETCRILGIA